MIYGAKKIFNVIKKINYHYEKAKNDIYKLIFYLIHIIQYFIKNDERVADRGSFYILKKN